MKDINRLFANFSQKLLNHDESIGYEIDEIFKYYSSQIGESVQPLNSISAPFVYRLLMEYAQAVQTNFPEEIKMADCLGKTQIIVMKL